MLLDWKSLSIFCLFLLISLSACDEAQNTNEEQESTEEFDVNDPKSFRLVTKDETKTIFEKLDENNDTFLDAYELILLAKMTFREDVDDANSFAEKLLKMANTDRLSFEDFYRFYLRSYDENRKSYEPPETNDALSDELDKLTDGRVTNKSTPRWFDDDPEFAWGFYGHRYNLYHNTTPHEGFHILRKWVAKMRKGHFVFTSNVDGHFQKAGFSEDTVVECHGSINFLQTVRGSKKIWPVPDDFEVQVDDETFRAKSPLPKGPPGKKAGLETLARPNILMFGDYYWNGDRTGKQEQRFEKWLKKVKSVPLVVIEIGAGLYVPTVRHLSESVIRSAGSADSCLIRINPNEPGIDGTNIRHVGLPLKGLEALSKIDQLLQNL